MVTRHLQLILLSLLVYSTQVNASTGFEIQLSDTQVELGKSIELRLSTVSSPDTLKGMDLAPLMKDFFVDSHADIKTDSGLVQWPLRLYPRHAGRLTVPVLQLENVRTSPIELKVTQPRDTKTGQTFHIKPFVSTLDPWINQQVIFGLSLQTQDQHVDLVTDSATLPAGRLQYIENSDHHPLASGKTQHRIGWNFFPDKVGVHTLELPPVYYRRDGVITHRFYLPQVTLNVRALPFYVPNNFPVGSLALEIHTPPILMLSKRLQTISITLHTNGITTHNLPDLENHVHSVAGLQVYPASSSVKQTADVNALTTRLDLEIPVKASSSGFIRLDDLDLAYFDPVAGKIVTLHFQWPQLFFISPWLLGLLSLFTLILIIFSSAMLYRFGMRLAHRYKYRRLARQHLLAATTPQEIKRALLLLSLAENGSDNTTLQRWHKNHLVDIQPLSRALYHSQAYDFQKLKQTYLGYMQSI